MPDICAKTEGFSVAELEELSVELEELSVKLDELSEELEFSVELALSVELEEHALSVVEEPEFSEEPTFSVTEELEFCEEYSITAPFEQPAKQARAIAAVIAAKIFLFKISLPVNLISGKKIAPRKTRGEIRCRSYRLVGAEGFEPPNDGVRVRCLTAWRRPSNQH